MRDTSHERFENSARFQTQVDLAMRQSRKSFGITSEQLRAAAEKVAELRDKQKSSLRH